MAMKAKEVKIEVKPFSEAIKKEDKIVVGSLEALRKVLTPKRLRLLHIAKKEKPESIYELAKLAERDRKSVVTDLEILEGLDLVEIREEIKGKRKKSRPVVGYSRVEIGIEI